MLEHKRLQAGYRAMCALNLSLSLPMLTPVVARVRVVACRAGIAEGAARWSPACKEGARDGRDARRLGSSFAAGGGRALRG